ncbi:hypothetical protein EVAR_81661_1 [Eumeta japonica]|uniref:DUF5641 domain-containing protein n=1 Tax=Eumeta variegata TaxID=151549 RepID=A0A4C1V249_EUMVA|nr:hypothetical protein EVAR_81661_1 [Eumeta japonica]
MTLSKSCIAVLKLTKDSAVLRNPKIHDLVMIADGTLPRNTWPRGKIVAVYPGQNQIMRAIDVKTNHDIKTHTKDRHLTNRRPRDISYVATQHSRRKCQRTLTGTLGRREYVTGGYKTQYNKYYILLNL